jgi:hypothetical protein
MSEKNVKTRIVHKHDIEANWRQAVNFTPKKGELIIYDPDTAYSYPRVKIGDGTTNVNNLKFVLYEELDKKANDFSIGFNINNAGGGNPRPIKFVSVNYSTCADHNGVMIKIGMVSGHGDCSNYVFLQDAIINVNYLGTVSVNNFKYYGATIDYSGARQYGDIFWVNNATDKVVNFYCLMGQYSNLNMTPYKRLTPSSGGTITQYNTYTGSMLYSSGTQVWANNSDIALASELSNLESTLQSQIDELDSNKLSLNGGKLTGAINVNDMASIDTNGYVTGTWVKMTADTSLGSTPTQGICVKQNGWIYTRTLEQVRSDIGAAASAHNQSASTITAGTFGGQTKANATAVANLETAQVRNICAGTSDLTAGSSALTTGDIYLVYE